MIEISSRRVNVKSKQLQNTRILTLETRDRCSKRRSSSILSESINYSIRQRVTTCIYILQLVVNLSTGWDSRFKLILL